MKVFVTGITSFLGKAFLPRLLDRLNDDDELFVLVRKEISFKDSRIKQLVGNLEEIEKFDKELLDCNYIFHIAANAVFGSDANYFEVNYVPTKKMIDILSKSEKIINFIYISSVGAFDRHKKDNCCTPLNNQSNPSPKSSYGKSKLASENYIKSSKVPYTIIRPAWIYGKNMRANSHINKFVNFVIDDNIVIKFAFRGKVSVIHVNDLAEALSRALNNQKIINKSYFAASENISIGEVFKLIYRKIHNKELKQLSVPKLDKIFSKIHNIFPVSIANLFLDYLCVDPENFWSDFNVFPETKIEDGILDVINSNAKMNGYYIITGANSGIGYSLVKLLDKSGKKMILIDKYIDNLSEFKDSHRIIKCDLVDFVNDNRLLEELNNYNIFCLINNAGVGLKGRIDILDENKIKEIVYVNALVPVLLTRKIISNLIKNEGVIVNIISNIAFNPLPNMSLYSASKAFLYNWSESLCYELRKTNLVVTFVPCGTLTNFQKNAGVKLLNNGRGLLSPDYVAQKVIDAIYKRKSFVVLGFTSKLLLTISKFLPRKINTFFWGKLFEKFR